MLISLIGVPLAAFAVGAVVRPPWRAWALLGVLAAPLLIYTLWLAGNPPSEPGFWQWWAVGLIYGAVPLLLSAGATLVGFKIGTTLAPHVDG